MSDKPFVHLHLHSQYSLLQSLIKVGPLVDRVAALGMDTVAITDQTNMYGAVEFQAVARKAGIRPIFGAEVYVTPFGRTQRQGKRRDNYHLQLLIENDAGYRNLCTLLTRGYFEGFYHVPRIDRELLTEHSEGLISISSNMRGEVATLWQRGQRDEALDAARFLATTFGEQRVYLELQDLGWDGQRDCNAGMREVAAEVGLPTVASNHTHYLEQADAYPHEALLCLGGQQTLNDVGRFRFPTDQFYLKSPDQMWALFPEDEEALRNTVAIAERCDFAFADTPTYHFPVRPGTEGQDPAKELARIAAEGLEARLESVRQREGDKKYAELEPVYRARLEEELGIIEGMGFASYFLIVHDFVRYSKENDIPVGPGRGSGAGSLVLYSLRITEIDPIRFDLLFERFLNPERISMPDVDIDFCQDRREEVIRYVNEAYGGRDRVCQIITFGKMLAKAVIRDVGRVMGLTYGEVDRIAKMIPDQLGITLAEAISVEPKLREAAREDPRVDKLLAIAQRLEGNCRHAGVHAAGLVISDRDLNEYLPLSVVSDTVTTQFDMKYAEKIGLIKFDFLGLKTLTQINEALNIARARGKTDLSFLQFNEIQLEDEATFQLLSKGDTLGVFQLESSGMRELVSTMRPSSFEDIIAAVALYRPGPMGMGMHTQYVERKHGRSRVEYPHEKIKDLLRNTYGIIVYQEQVMQIAQQMAGYSLGMADQLRRAMGKKIVAEMETHRKVFVDGAAERNVPSQKSEEVFNHLAEFAKYGFNKSHSAAYALIAYQTAYLKAHFPEEFFASLLTIERNNTDKVLLYIDDARKHGIQVLPPDVNESLWGFTVVDGGIRFGLSAVKNVGDGAVESILEGREAVGRLETIDQFLESVDPRRVNKRVIESLIKCGAFDSIGHSRSALFDALEALVECATRTAQDKAIGQESLFGGQQTSGVHIPDQEEWPEKERLANEKEALGFFITGHPMDAYSEEVERFATCDTTTLQNCKDGAEVAIAGTLSGVQRKLNKKGDPWTLARLEDMVGGVSIKFFARANKKYGDSLVEDVPLLVEGRASRGMDGSVELLGDKAQLLETVRQEGTRQMWLHVDAETLDEERLVALRELLAAHEGPCRVGFRIRVAGETEVDLRLPESVQIAAVDDLRDGVNRVFEGRVVKYR